MAKKRKNKGCYIRKNKAWNKGIKMNQNYEEIPSVSSQQCLSRPRREAYNGAKLPGIVMPSKLRPLKEEKVEILQNTDVSNENIIVNLEKLAEFSKVNAHHSWHDDRACSVFTPEIKISKRTGLCISLVSFCSRCSASSREMPLYECGGRRGTRGPIPGNLNQGLLLPIIKTKAGASDISFFLASLNIKQPNTSLMYKNVNKLCDQVEEINKVSLVQNQEFVREVNQVRGEATDISAESDTSYNNRPQAGFEAGTQSFTPLVEQQTNRKLVIEMNVTNKLCSRRNCEHNTVDCKKNYNMEDSIASSESAATERNLRAIADSQILKVARITCDGSNQIPNVLNNVSRDLNYTIRQHVCSIHYLRTFQKNIKKLSITTIMPGVDKTIFVQKLSSSLRMRIYSELSRLSRRNLDENTFVEKARSSILNVLPCFSNKHKECRKISLICNAHLDRYNLKYLPYNRHLNLNAIDYNKIKCLTSSTFSEENLKRLYGFRNTNKAEALHHKVYTVAPKSTVWSRNFSGLCHSSVHSSTHKIGKSTLLIAKAIGIKYAANDPFSLYMNKADKLFEYRKKYQMTLKYKMKRYLSRKRRCNRKLIQNSMYRNQNHSSVVDHAYGNNPGK